jgi:thymidylate kinase
MSKSSKKNGKPEKKKDKPTAGQIIALEGTRGKDLVEAAERLARHGQEGGGAAGFSRWDASNTFYELSMGKARKHLATPRTLVLLYVSDLLFRLRWEIKPALAEGRTIIAAPYLETVTGFGLAAGLPKEWLRELLSFVPKPATVYRLKEKTKAKAAKINSPKAKDKRQKPADGFVEFCSDSLAATSPDWNAVELRAGILGYLDELEGKDQILRLGKKAPKGLGKKK